MFAFFFAPMGYQKAKSLGLTYEQMQAFMKVRDKLSRQECPDFNMKTWVTCLCHEVNKELSGRNKLPVPYAVHESDRDNPLRRLFHDYTELTARNQLHAAERINAFLAGGESCQTNPTEQRT